MRGTGEYFSGVGAAPLSVPPGIRAAVAKRKFFNNCIAKHAPSPNRAAKCQAMTVQWAHERGMAGMGEYFSGVGDSLTIGTTSDDDSWKKPWFIGLFVGVLVGYSAAHLLKK